ncbi:hypothetical protein J437_LFUL007146 [Ladona fulva]|uniref:RRM domain-containing protein n=1 Tax=Ladona fulva TaxID=123851 RepID=A0A8K0P1R8_LADFU|nr:hypothetical protein J437_LFUL007146 [Ladona fulva]
MALTLSFKFQGLQAHRPVFCPYIYTAFFCVDSQSELPPLILEMANVNLSLDEIIQKKFKFSAGKGRGRGVINQRGAKRSGRGRGGVVQTTAKPSQNTKLSVGVKAPQTAAAAGKPKAARGDARLTIIAKKRLKLNDARDRLAELAKQSGDAREKLTQLRRTKLVGSVSKLPWAGTLQSDPLRTVRGGNITVRKGRNGRISLSTKRNVEMMWKPITKSWDWGKGNSVPYHDLDDPGENMNNVVLRQPLSGDSDPASTRSLLLRRTVNNDQMHTSRPPPLPPLPPSVHSFRSAISAASDRGAVGLQALGMSNPWAKGNTPPHHYDLRAPPPRLPRQGMPLLLSEREEWGGGESGAISSFHGHSSLSAKRNSHNPLPGDHLTSNKGFMEDEEVVRLDEEEEAEDEAEEEEYALMGINARKAGRISRELKASNPTRTSTQHQRVPVSGAQDSSISQQRYKVKVSNLQPTVTQEDIRELFEDIGPLACPPKLLPPPSGEAIVCFRSRADAARAVDVYHLRQLDGQPMRCSLAISNNSNSGPLKSQQSLATNNGMHSATTRPSMTTTSSTLKLPSGGKTPVMPDIATIHKALFNKA